MHQIACNQAENDGYKGFNIFNNTSEISSHVLLAFTSSNVPLKNAFNECLGVGNVFPSAAQVQIRLLIYMLKIVCGLWLR